MEWATSGRRVSTLEERSDGCSVLHTLDDVRAGDAAELVQRLPGGHKALGLIPQHWVKPGTVVVQPAIPGVGR